MIVQIVRFKSGLQPEDVQRTYEDRASRYRAMPGLLQKYYLRFPATEEHGAVYVWDSLEALSRFRESDLARTISSAYQVQGASDIEVAEVVMTLRPEALARSPG